MNKTVFRLSLVLSALIIIANGAGLLIPDQLYHNETPNWYAQAIGQDLADLLTVLPLLLITSWLAYRQHKPALMMWAGILAYIIYTFAIYCFAVHFNQLFLVYCMILGLSFYLFVWFLLSHYRQPVRDWFAENIPVKLAGVYMITISTVFFMLWLSQLIPASLDNTVPKEITDVGLLTNPVHVLDIAVCLPGITITGILLLRRHPMGLLLAPAVLTFFILMDIALGGLIFVMKWKGLDANYMLAAIMFVLAFFSAVVLMLYFKNMKADS